MEWADVIIAPIAASGGFLGSVLSNNKQLAIVQTKLDTVKEELTKQGFRIDRHNHLNERLTVLEVKEKERERCENTG